MLEVQLPIRLLLGGIFQVSGVLKLVHWTEFHDTFSAMELFPRWLSEFICYLLPPVEFVLGLSVVMGWRLALTGPLLLALVIGFIAGLGVYRLRGKRKLVCGCFADFDRERTTVSLILRNLLLAVAVVLLLLTGPAAAAQKWYDWLLASVTAAGAVLSWILLSLFADTVGSLRSYDVAEES